MNDSRLGKLQAFVDWSQQHITGDEKGQAHIFLDRLFQAFGQKGSLDVGGEPEMRIRKGKEDGGGTSFADYVWKPVVLIEIWLRFITKCSKLTERFRYTPETVFNTFPWPQSPTKAQIDAVAKAGWEVRRVREKALKVIDGGLREVYRTLELPGKHPLKDAHAALDAAVLDACCRRDNGLETRATKSHHLSIPLTSLTLFG